MTDGSVTNSPESRSAQRLPLLLVGSGLLVCAAIAGVQAHADRFSDLSVVLLISALVAGLTVVPSLDRASVSAGFIVLLLAAALLGPATAAACAVATELAAARKLHTPREA